MEDGELTTIMEMSREQLLAAARETKTELFAELMQARGFSPAMITRMRPVIEEFLLLTSPTSMRKES